MVTPLLLLSMEDKLMMNCLPVCLTMFMIQSSTGSCGVGVLTFRGKRRLPGAPGLLGIRQLYKITGQHSVNYPPSFLFRYLKRLVRIFYLDHSVQLLVIYPPIIKKLRNYLCYVSLVNVGLSWEGIFDHLLLSAISILDADESSSVRQRSDRTKLRSSFHSRVSAV